MKHSTLFSTVILLAGLVFGACNSSDDDNNNLVLGNPAYTVVTVTEDPAWRVDWNYNQARPDWQEPVTSSFENWAVLLVKIEDELRPYVDENDMMALFVDGELRGLSTPAINISADGKDNYEAYFLIKAYGNDAGQTQINVTLRYYSSRLQHIFSRSSQILYVPNEVYGLEEDLLPKFTLGAEKYPVQHVLQLSETPLATSGLQPVQGDMVAAFVGDECRGVLTLDDQLMGPSVFMTVFGRQAGESVTLKYFDTKAKCMYIFYNSLKLNEKY